jgi:uncharacterized membrane protein
MQNRFKSKILWVSIGTQILSILIALGLIDTGCSELMETILISVCELFVAFGILNNPTSKNTL